jgi:hypothetical protein
MDAYVTEICKLRSKQQSGESLLISPSNQSVLGFYNHILVLFFSGLKPAVRRLHDLRCGLAPKFDRPCLRSGFQFIRADATRPHACLMPRPHLFIEDDGAPIKKACMHLCAHVLLQAYTCMQRMSIQGKLGDHVVYKITQANSTVPEMTSKFCTCCYVHIHHRKQARGPRHSASQYKTSPRSCLASHNGFAERRYAELAARSATMTRPRRLLRQQLTRPR